MKRGLRHPIEALRTAPVQLPMVGLNATVAALATYEALELEQVPERSVEWGIVAFNLGCVALNAVLARSKINHRDRIESHLVQNGFDDRTMTLTLDTYCTRQATKIACENIGHSEEYTALLARNPKEGDLRWLPHI
jgi:hypothetical protein